MHFEVRPVSRGNASIRMHLRLAVFSGVRTLAQSSGYPPDLNSYGRSADQLGMDEPMQATRGERVAGPTQFGEMFPVTVGLLIWISILAPEGWKVGIDTGWILL